MDTIKINSSGAKLIAHRGLSGIERENTNAAFIAAGNRSYYGIETDVHVTRDGNFVTIHDATTGRVAEKNINVERSRIKKISKILLNDKEGKRGRTDLKIPMLSEYIAICKTYGKVCVLEMKNKISPKNIEKMLGEIRDMNYLPNIIFISFDKRNLIALREIYPEAPVQFLASEYDPKVLEFITENKFDLDINYRVVNADIVRAVHEAGLKINCWTCDDAQTAEKLIDMGVDYITTNILE